MTIEQIKNEDNFLCGLELPQYNVKVYLVYAGNAGKVRIHYRFYYKDKLLFEGKDFLQSVLRSPDSIEAVVELCTFLCFQPGDVDNEYFAAYTPEQLAWTETDDRDGLNLLLSDFGNTENDGEAVECRMAAKKELEEAFIPY